MLKKIFFLFLLAFLAIRLSAQTTETSSADLNTRLKPVKWRNIGPFRGGRSVAVSGVAGDPTTYYMGTTGGGLWKTDDLGQNWRNISDGFFTTGSVGAISVAESDPNIVYVGMGEHAVRGVMTHHGDGMYKSADGGKTWKKTGLAHTGHIARIAVHPTDPNTVFVAAQGALYGRSAERGIFKSTDGGANWKKVLYVDDKTGCAELSMDINNPRILYAAMWEHGRLPWQVISGGPGSGLYKSVDGGETWQRLSDGLPKEMGKMSVAVCRSNPEKVYALIESDSEKEAGGLFVSNNAGKNWSRITNDHRLVQRAWYYIELFTDPHNDNTLYVLSAPALRSTDGGKTWEELSGTHGDYHDLWINPKNPKNMIIGNDGGAAVSVNSGKTWSPQDNMPTAQIYRINVDNQFPYRIYGGQQDNTSVSIAHREPGGRHITPASWTYSAGGESAFLAFDPDNPRHVLGGSYQGTIEVLDTRARAGTNIMAAPIQYLGRDAKDMKYRYNWNAPIIWSKHEPNTFYHAAQLLLRTRTNEAVGAENYGTLSYVVESPHEKGVIWTGSDDGLVYLTRDGGANWRNVTPPGLTECLINAIEVSPHDKATAYIATTRYKFNDHRPGLYKTTDYGASWAKISNGIPDTAFTRVVREDDVRKDLLFAGTETGLFISWDGGKNWTSFQLNLPVTPITDLRIHQGDLIAATSGRSFWILDDLGLLRQYRAGASPAPHLYQPENAILMNGGSELNKTDESFTGMYPSGGVNPANGIVLYYELPELKPGETLTLEVLDADGKPVRSFSSVKDSLAQTWEGGPPPEPALTTGKGLNRFVWDLRYPTLPGIPGTYFENSFTGHKASPGKYTFQLKLGERQVSATAEILPNPLYPTTAAEYAEYHRIMLEMETNLTTMHRLVNSLHAKHEQLEQLLAALPAGDKFKAVRETGQALAKKMKAWDEDMVQRKSKAYDDVENFPNKFTANYLFLLNQTESDIPRVNQPSLDLKRQLDAEWSALKVRANELLEKDLPTFNRLLWEAGIGGVWRE
ncbi:MAG: glycosyl hydrolase [Thermoanaerobaculia bacterium]|nr:glycosyl hydrolase [Thermoanaerobaculia bacterium]